MALNKVELCGINTGTLPVLKNDQMRVMLEKIKRGDDLEDLFQIGCIGLIKSIDNFDLSQNVRFSTYAVPMAVACRKARGDERAGERAGKSVDFRPLPARRRAVEKNLRKIEKTY